MLESGLRPIFCFLDGSMKRQASLEKLITPIVEGFGLDLIGIQYLPQGKRSILRVFMDRPEVGVTAEDCALVSRQVNAVLEVEGLLEDYLLEVSSPGLDRILFSLKQCQEQIGKLIAIRLIVPMAGKRNLKGRLQRIEGEQLCMLIESKEIILSFTDIDEARVVPEW